MLFCSGSFLWLYSEEALNGWQFTDLKSISGVHDSVDYISETTSQGFKLLPLKKGKVESFLVLLFSNNTKLPLVGTFLFNNPVKLLKLTTSSTARIILICNLMYQSTYILLFHFISCKFSFWSVWAAFWSSESIVTSIHHIYSCIYPLWEKWK